MTHAVTISSPYVWEAADFTRINVIRLTVTFDNATRAVQGATVFRDAACRYKKVYVGLGPSGIPDDTPRAFAVPPGTTAFSAAQLGAVGLHTIEDILSFQLTAGP